jgi:hypothetical protein
MYTGRHVKYPLFLSDFDLEFSRQISKNTQISKFVKIRPLGAELFHADGRMDRQTDTTKLTVAFHNFANVPET